MTPEGQRSGLNSKNLGVEYLKNGTRYKKVSIEVKQEVIYGLSNVENIFDLG